MFEPLPDLAYFRLLVGDSQAIPLLEAAASIGVVAYPALDLQGTLSTFDGLAGQVADSCRGASTEALRQLPGVASVRDSAPLLEVKVSAFDDATLPALQALGIDIESVEPMSLEDIFVTTVRGSTQA